MKQLVHLFSPCLVRAPWALLGAAAGYCFYRGCLCASGTCALTSTPVYSVLMGGLAGLLLRELLTPNKLKPEE